MRMKNSYVSVMMLSALSALGACSAGSAPEEDWDDSHAPLLSDGSVRGDSLPPYTIALTYDDGPDVHTEELAWWLSEQGIQATFFVNGCRLQGSPQPVPGVQESCLSNLNTGERFPLLPESVLGSVRAMGHRIANHTQDHASLPDHVASPQVVLNQIKVAQTVVDRHVSDGYYLLRAPHDAWNSSVASILRGDATLNKLIGPVTWELDSALGDWGCQEHQVNVLGKTIEAATEVCGQAFLDNIQASPNHNGIMLLHDRQEFAPGTDYALRLTKWIVERIDRDLYTFVPLDAVPNLPGLLQSKPAAMWSTHYTDAEGFGAARSGYGSLRYGDLNKDGKADVCGRRADGIYCAVASSSAFQNWTRWISTTFTDAAGFAANQYGSTLQLGDINGDGRADICGRGAAGLSCALSTGTAFGSAKLWSSNSDFSDADGWGSEPGKYGSIDLGDVNGDGKADVCGRAAIGVVCALSNGSKFGGKAAWKTNEYTDAVGWSPEQHGATVQLADLNGDRKADVCGRGSSGIVCALSNGTSFGESRWTWSRFDDRGHWSRASSRYLSIRMADVNGDGKADMCGRNTTGVACQFSKGDGTFGDYRYLNNAEFRDTEGFSAEKYGMTLALADLNADGRADLCARQSNGLRCALSP